MALRLWCYILRLFVCLYLRAEFKRKQLKSSPAPENESIPITPEMLAVVASDDAPETEEPVTHKERLKDIDTCLQKAISDCAQGKISAKEFADICALLRKVENEPSISTHEAAKSSQQPSIEETYPIEDDNGFLVRVPADKLDSWTAADHDAPLTPAEEQFVENLLDNLYHKTVVKDKPSVTEPKASGGFNQSKAPLPPEQDRTVEKPIGCIPNSSYVPIPWYRNTKILAHLALGLIAAVLICSVIFAVVPGLPDPTAAVSSPHAANSAPSPAATTTPPPAASPAQTLSSPIQHPISGSLFCENTYAGDRIAPLTVDASGQPSGIGFYVKLRFPKSKTPVLAFFVRGGSKVDIDVPLGLFELVYASGTDWYGGEHLFGPDTQYFLADEQFDFYEEDGYINGWTVTLSKQINGNLDIDQIPADQF